MLLRSQAGDGGKDEGKVEGEGGGAEEGGGRGVEERARVPLQRLTEYVFHLEH